MLFSGVVNSINSFQLFYNTSFNVNRINELEENEIHVHFISFDHDTGQTAILVTEHYPTFRHFYNKEKKKSFFRSTELNVS